MADLGIKLNNLVNAVNVLDKIYIETDIETPDNVLEQLSNIKSYTMELLSDLYKLEEAKRLLQAAEKTINDYCRGYCECCKNRDFELARCGLVNGCRDRDNWEWILSYRIKELFKEE